jgi:hypothetical protein
MQRLPQAETVVWPVGHHFPHLAYPDRFAALLTVSTRFRTGGHGNGQENASKVTFANVTALLALVFAIVGHMRTATRCP